MALVHNSLISRDIKAKSAFRQILAAEGAKRCDIIADYHITKLTRYNELCTKTHKDKLTELTMKNLFKKFLVICGIIGAISTTSGFIGTQSASAIDPVQSRCEYFLGLYSWDCNVNISDEASLKSGIWIIAANIATDITILAAYLVIGYVIYGGYLYVFSGGEPGKLATGKKALSQAFIGLAIVMSANVILNTIRIALGADFTKNCATSDACEKAASAMVDHAISWVISIAGIVSAIFVVYGGISYATSAGEPGKLQKAKSMITYALIGLAIVALARVITAFVFNMIREANNPTTSLIIDTTKEHYENQKIS